MMDLSCTPGSHLSPFFARATKAMHFKRKKIKTVSQSTWNKFNSFEHISCSLLSPVAFCGETVHSVCRNHKPEIKKEDVFAVRSHSNEIFIHWFLMCGFVRRKARFVCIYILRVMWWPSHPEVFFFPNNLFLAQTLWGLIIRVTMSGECKLHF